MQILNEEKLKPCPFCGGDADISDSSGLIGCGMNLEYYVVCEECLAKGEEFGNPKDAIEAWNRRHDAKNTDAG